MQRQNRIIGAFLLSTVISGASGAGTVSPIQSSATPFGLQPIADVQLAGSDAAAADFFNNALPDLQSAVDSVLTEQQPLINLSSIALDANDLYLAETSEVRVYFIGEGAGYHNSFGIYTGDSSAALTGDAALVFPDASSSSSYLDPTGSDYRSANAPVAAGDFVELGTFESGTQLNLFLIANGANGGTNTYFTDIALNPDGIEHYVVLATPDSPYLLVGAEDLFGGGDKDYNDIVVAFDIGTANVQQLVSNAVPLPGPVAALLGPLCLALFVRFKRRRFAANKMTPC
ncbi:MAG: DUF4114 domain-containing protein [Kordiimonadaceae bacterium]|nr:DUF4114 domain-containing protein [Kordiimonadaceae bacterium]